MSMAGSVMLWLILGTLSTLSGCAGPQATLHSDGVRDFPPLVDPNAPAQTGQAQIPSGSGDLGAVDALAFEPSERVQVPSPDESPAADDYNSVYRLGVADEISVVVLGHPTYTRPVKVLPDGSISSTGTGTVHVLGLTVTEAAREIEDRLAKTLRYPQVDLVVTKYGDHVVYVMGEVENPADHTYRKGMSALQAVAAAGGFLNTAKRTNVFVFRRTGPDAAELIQLDLEDPLAGNHLENDLMLRPYDIVYVPKSVIGNVNTFIDQYLRQTLSVVVLYLNGWYSYTIARDSVFVRRL